MAGDLIYEGAEAVLTQSSFLGIRTVRKTRAPKPYRVPELDAAIRRARMRDEALLLHEARRAGVRVPHVLDVDVEEGALEIERIDGRPLRVLIEEGVAPLSAVEAFGAAVGRLHQAGLAHGDPTTSNVLISTEGPVLIDFGLAHRSTELEDHGVDLVLVQRTFEAAHPGRAGLWEAFERGYRTTAAAAEAALQRAREIRARGRYV